MTLNICDTRAEALFLAPVTHQERLTRAATDMLIAAQVKLYGVRGCAEACAYEYGEHPVEACARMNWAIATVDALYGRKAA